MVVKGSVDSFKYVNDINHFGIFILNTSEVKDGSIAVTGNVFGLSEGDYIEVTGSEVIHPVYGKQIKMTSYRAVQPTDTDAVIKYLASGALKGIGPKMAVRIFSTFGVNTLDILEKEPERLAEVKGISENMARNIAIEYASLHCQRMAIASANHAVDGRPFIGLIPGDIGIVKEHLYGKHVFSRPQIGCQLHRFIILPIQIAFAGA